MNGTRTHSIGTERESGLHRALKFRYAGEGGLTEYPLGDYVCDAYTGEGEAVEIQTGSFAPLKEKAKALSRLGPVRIIHPVIIEKYIEHYDTAGCLLRRRKSTRRGSSWDLFKNLLYAPALPLLEGLSIELVLVDAVEKRVNDGKGSWRRKGESIAGRELAAWHEVICLAGPDDYRRFVPFTEDEEFGVKDLSGKAGINSTLARKTLYVLTKMGLLVRAGKRGRAIIYRQKKA